MRVSRNVVLALLGMLLGSSALMAQTGTVVGRVVDDATKQPLSGVAVTIAQRGALTTSDGRYTITGVPVGTNTVRATLIGYSDVAQTVTVNAAATATADFALTMKAVEVAQLVVIGYGEQRAGNITGAVKQVSGAELNPGRIVSPQELIQSKVAGVQVVDNNEPGGGLSVRIRGATSVNASSDPLYVLDGVPLGSGGSTVGRNPLNFIAPEDIESITVLKDAASAAIYGANAANGVVLITTKKAGRRIGLEYTGSISGSQITRRPDMLNADQFRSAVQTYASQNVSQLQSANTNWFDLITRNAFGQDHNLAFSSAGDANSFRFSGGYLNQNGVIDGTTTERVSASLNYDQRLFTDHLTLRTSLKGARTYDLFTPGGVLSNAAQMGPTQPVNDPTARDGFYNWPGNQLTSADNPLQILNFATDQGTTYRTVGNLQAEYRLPFFESLRANVNLGYDLTKGDREGFRPSTIHDQLKTGNGGSTFRNNINVLNTVLEAYGNYTPRLTGIPGNIDLTGGYSYSFSHGDFPSVNASKLSTNLLGDNGFVGAGQLQYTSNIQDSKLISFFGRVNYNINDKYLIAASVRRDGSSRFGPGNAWGTFPAISLAWRLSQEPMFQNMGLSDLKLRGSWGKTGNQSFANYQQYTTYVVGDAQTQVLFGNEYVTTIRPSAADPNIKWEETNAYNVGVDYGFSNNRFTGTVDFYRKKTSDLIFTVPVAAGTNLSNFLTTNIGAMRNTGVEASLSAKLLSGSTRKFTWTADFNAAHNTNELTTINPFGGSSQQILTGLVAGGVGTFIQVLTPGQPINSFFVYEHKREGGKPIYKDVTGIGADGKFNNTPDKTINEQDLYVDQNGDGHIDQLDRRPFHDPAPKWILGHSSYMTMGKADASFTLRAYLGSYTYNNVASNLGTYSEVTRGSPYNLHASVLETGFVTPQYLSDYYVEDASFLRMDNITAGYSFNYRGQPMRVFASVQNAFTITGYNGVDPTAGLNGIDNNIYPRSRTFSGGLNVRF